jgi:hypothetical protein
MSTQLYLAVATRGTFANGPAESRKALFTHDPEADIREDAHTALFNEDGLWFVDAYDLRIYQLKKIESWRVIVGKIES